MCQRFAKRLECCGALKALVVTMVDPVFGTRPLLFTTDMVVGGHHKLFVTQATHPRIVLLGVKPKLT